MTKRREVRMLMDNTPKNLLLEEAEKERQQRRERLNDANFRKVDGSPSWKTESNSIVPDPVEHLEPRKPL